MGDLTELSAYVSATWSAAAELDWSVQAGTVEWSCLHTADHAVDCVWAPAFFLASRRQDQYSEIGTNMAVGEDATPALIVESLEIATRVLTAVINGATPDVRAVIFRWPEILLGTPFDFAPRAATELILHAHDVCQGLGVSFEPDAELCHRLREHTRPWPMWTMWQGLPETDDPWEDLLLGAGRNRA